MPRRTVTIKPTNIHLYRTGSFSSSRLVWACPRIDRQVLSNFGRLRKLVIEEPLELDGLEGIQVCSSLSYLKIDGPCNIRPISALTNLVTLIINSDTRTIIPILTCTKLRVLKISSGVEYPPVDLSGIENLRELRHLTACLNVPIAFSTLAVLTNLAYIDVDYYGVLVPMPSLLSLVVDTETDVSNRLKQLKVLPQLRALDCTFSTLEDLDQIQHMIHLERLTIMSDAKLRNIRIVRSFPRLKNFTCWCESIESISNIKYCPLLRTFDCSGCKLTDLEGLGFCVDLRTVYIWCVSGPAESYSLSIKELATCCRLKEFYSQYVELRDAHVIGNWTQIENLSVCDTGLTNIDFLTNCPKLEDLNICNNHISCIDHLKAPRLRTLSTMHTNIRSIPFERYPQLVSLHTNDCAIQNWPDIRYCQNLRSLHAIHCGLKTMDHLVSPNLRTLQVSSNELTTFPFEKYPLLTILEISYNNLTSIDGVILCPQLQSLGISYNQITNFSPICYLQNLQILFFNSNPLAPQDPRTARILNRFIHRARTVNSIYTDTQNVHDSRIQMSVNNSVRNLLKDPVVTFDPQSIIESDLPAETKGTIINYCTCDAVHSTHDLTYAELFAYVWARIQKHEARTELYSILADQIKDSECKCFTGRFNRTLSVLIGFYEDIFINISDSSRISAIIIATGDHLDPYIAAAHRDTATQALTESGYSLTDIQPWLDAIED